MKRLLFITQVLFFTFCCPTATLTYRQSSLVQSSLGYSDTIHHDDYTWHCWHTYTHHCTAYQTDPLDTLEITNNL